MRHLSNRRIARLAAALPAITVVLAVLTVASACGEARAEKAPTAAEVLDRFVEVTGGIKAYDALENRKASATLSIPAQGMTFDITMWSARPDRVYSVIENPMLGQIRKGVSGDVVWEISVMTGPIIREGSQRESTLRESVFERYVYWRDNFETAELSGEDTVGGEECWKVVLTPAGGDAYTMYFEKGSGLLVRVDTIADTEMGKIPVEAYLGDYRDAGGIKMSYKTVIKILGQERVFTTTGVEHNVELPEGIFDLPEEIKALQE